MVELGSKYRLIALDERHAGRSRAPLSAQDGWHTYTADHVALLDHLGIEKAHVMGSCIGVSFALALIEAQPWRVSAAILAKPIGMWAGRDREGCLKNFDDRTRGWLGEATGAGPEVLDAFRDGLYMNDFVYSVTRDFVRRCDTPMMVFPGDDVSHPRVIAEEIGRLAANAELIADWRRPEALAVAVRRAHAFLKEHTPAVGG
ncbi:MAG: alpha/beta fold hydrolase [Chloroflexi bacterium]|nr:alpha/beta fold hydrolase [Chloroflexota bacterium]